MEKIQVFLETINGEKIPVEGGDWTIVDEYLHKKKYSPFILEEITNVVIDQIKLFIVKEKIYIADIKNISFEKLGGDK